MLGRPLITSIKHGRAPRLPYLVEAPAQHADEATVYDELKALLGDADRRRRMGLASRAFALKWHAQDVCAARFETVIDRVRSGLPADPDNVLGTADGETDGSATSPSAAAASSLAASPHRP
jgi:hypothetical protein